MPRKSALGPYDQRKKVRRCENCASRKVKCVGDIPCQLCIRTGKPCQRQSSEPSQAVFVLYEEKKSGMLLPKQMTTDAKTVYVDYFVTFLRRNQFAHCANALVEDLLPLVNTSPLLSSIISAIGALDASRHGTRASYANVETPRFLAFESYSSSIRSLSIALLDPMVSQRDDVLWATFFLGLFELMVDPSGDGWTKHMLHGTSRLLQAAGPDQIITASRTAFLKVFRIFEANRAVLYGEDTILSSTDWAPLFSMYQHGYKDGRDGLSRVSSFMVQISIFNTRFYQYVASVASFDGFDPFLEHFGLEAATIQNEISTLQAQTINTGLLGFPSLEYYQILLYCHTMSIFLFNTFDYYHCWHLDHSPYMSAQETGRHVDQISRLADLILNTPGGSGILLIFPLRVAGTRADTDLQKAKVLDLLDRIARCGFIVANRIRDDVEDLWGWKANSLDLPSKSAN
ncbi:hypothetical protein BJX96DRAFT_188096 [Aspergillus floccosus]